MIIQKAAFQTQSPQKLKQLQFFSLAPTASATNQTSEEQQQRHLLIRTVVHIVI